MLWAAYRDERTLKFAEDCPDLWCPLSTVEFNEHSALYFTSMPLSGLPVVGDVFTHASTAGVRVVLTSS